MNDTFESDIPVQRVPHSGPTVRRGSAATEMNAVDKIEPVIDNVELCISAESTPFHVVLFPSCARGISVERR